MNQETAIQTKAKPLGLILTSIYTAISAILSILTGAGLLFAGGAAGGLAPQWLPIFAFAILLFGVVASAAAYGLWGLVPWGHSLARVIYIVSIPLGLLAMLPDRTMGNVILQLVGIALAVWILMYLAKPEIKNLFPAS